MPSNSSTSFCISQVEQTFKKECFRVGYSFVKKIRRIEAAWANQSSKVDEFRHIPHQLVVATTSNVDFHNSIYPLSRLSMISAVFILFCSLVEGLKDI
jgi:hypothetical protein